MLQELWPFCKKNKANIEDTKQNSDIANIHSISIVLHSDDAVDILLMHPNLEKISVVEISSEAERFAELLVYTINITMEQKLLAVIVSKSKTTESIKEQLFYDNVIYYYQLIKADFEKSLLSNGPVVRPIVALNPK